MSVDKQKQDKVKDLLNKANFLRAFTEEDLLIARIESELSKIVAIIVETSYALTGDVVWHYTIAGHNEWEHNTHNRLTSLLGQMEYFIT